MKDLLTIAEVDRAAISDILALAELFKATPLARPTRLSHQVIVELYAKPSTRTRLSFAAAVNRLGGTVEVVSGNDLQLGRGESVEDTARSISRFAAAFIIRTHDHDEVVRFANEATIPVINALTRLHHPLQALTDAFTIEEKLGAFVGPTIAYVGDGNNVANSLIEMAAKLGGQIRIATPAGREPNDYLVEQAQKRAADTGGLVEIGNDPQAAVENADVVYADVWASMGEEDIELPRQQFEAYQVNESLMKLAKPDAIFMHCLPAHRGEEVTNEVIDGKQSVVFDQAENRMHIAQAVLSYLTPSFS